MDDLRAISSNEFPTDVSARTTNSRLSWLIVSCQQHSIILFGYIGNKLERKKKKERGGEGGRGGEALRILKNQREREGETSHYGKGSVSLQIIKDGHNYRGNVIFNGFQQNTYVRETSPRTRGRSRFPVVERSRMRCYTRSRPSF